MFKKGQRFKAFAAVLSVFLLFTGNLTALAQSSGTIQGAVTDPSGAAVAGAKVVVRNEATGEERTTQTDSDGAYQVAALPVGTYQIQVQAQGFQTHMAKGLTLEVSQTVVQNVQLSVGEVTQEVTVVAEAPMVETSTITVGQSIDRKTVQEIPLNGRHFVDLGLLIPGTVTPPQNGFLTAPLRGQGSFAINTAGNREDTVNFMINGINLNDMVQNQITFQPSINTVQEFKVDNSTFSAEYGRNSGAIVNIATRSGTNQFHGEAFEFIRNDALDARNFFDAKKGPFKRNQFGAAIGGPIIKDKTFFFGTYEGLRQRQGLTINSGVFSDADRATATDPTIVKLLTLIPRANAFTTNPRFLGAATAPVNIDQGTGDVSHVLGPNDRIHGYYAFQRDFRGEPILQGNTIPGFGDIRQSHRQIFTLNEVHTFGPHLVNEATFGFNRIHITFMPNSAMINPADFGVIGVGTDPVFLPQINIQGVALNLGGPAGFPQGRGDTTFAFSDKASYLYGSHSIKFGVEFRDFYNNNFTEDPGSFNFSSGANFLQDKANQFSVTLGGVFSSVSTKSVGFFVQDSIKARPNLTLELGLRYDVNTSPTERFDRFVNFDPSTDSLLRVPQGYDTRKHNLQPRLGFAWDPFKDGKTSVRGAYAILYDQPVTNSITGLAGNPPLATPLLAASGSNGISFHNFINVAGASGLAPSAINEAFQNPYVQTYNLNIEREITPTLGIMVGYFGSTGTDLRISRNVNQFINGVRPFPKLSPTSPILPGATLGNVIEVDSAGVSRYNSLWITATKRFSHGLQFLASYTLSKSLDYNSQSSQGVVVQDSNNVQGDRGLSDYDARHRFVINAIYELPFRGNRVVEGWQVSSIVQVQSGNPVNILAGGISFTGLANTVRPDVIGSIQTIGSPTQWFTNTVCDPRVAGSCGSGAVFALPAATVGGTTVFHFGDLGRNVIIGPGFFNTDFSVLKTTKLTESLKLQFRAEMFDIFNHANFGQPGRIAAVGSTSFGVITNTRFATGDSGSSRQMQFALKFIF
jgi:hypothetical protein